MYNNNNNNPGAGGGNYNSNNSNAFNQINNNNSTSKTLFKLRLLAGCVGAMAILKLLAGDYNGFDSDLMTCLFIFLTTYCINGFLAGFLVITLLFSVIITTVFFALQIQNSVFDIPNTTTKNKLVMLYVINCLGLVFYSFAIYYCYAFYSDSKGELNRLNNNSNSYPLMNDNAAPQQRDYYGSLESGENSKTQQQANFKAFAGKGTKLYH